MLRWYALVLALGAVTLVHVIGAIVSPHGAMQAILYATNTPVWGGLTALAVLKAKREAMN